MGQHRDLNFKKGGGQRSLGLSKLQSHITYYSLKVREAIVMGLISMVGLEHKAQPSKGPPLGPTPTGFTHKMFLTRNRKQMFYWGRGQRAALAGRLCRCWEVYNDAALPAGSFLTCGQNRGTEARRGPDYGKWTQGSSQPLK